jgi:hypothetical protein
MKEVQRESMMFQRKILGILCMLLAPSSILFGLIGKGTNLPYWYASISATYYANDKIIMIGLLYAIFIFFSAYKGYDWRDRTCSIIQAITSFMIVAFPCSTTGAPDKVGLFMLPLSTSNIIHCIGASLLFFTFSFNVIFLFRLSGPEPTEKKKLRNKIYLACGIIIFIFMVLQAIYSVTSLFDFIPSWFPITWFNEFVMLEAFGFAYLVKSEAIDKLNDK